MKNLVWAILLVSCAKPDDVSAQATTLAAVVSPLPPQQNLSLTDILELQISRIQVETVRFLV